MYGNGNSFTLLNNRQLYILFPRVENKTSKKILIRTYNSRRIARERGKHAVEPGVRDDHKRDTRLRALGHRVRVDRVSGLHRKHRDYYSAQTRPDHDHAEHSAHRARHQRHTRAAGERAHCAHVLPHVESIRRLGGVSGG